MTDIVPLPSGVVELIIKTASDLQVIETPAAQGPAGPPGPPGRAQQSIFDFPSAVTPWHILHNLGAQPIVSVRDVNGFEVWAEIQHVDNTQLYVNFSAPFAGSAVLI